MNNLNESAVKTYSVSVKLPPISILKKIKNKITTRFQEDEKEYLPFPDFTNWIGVL